MPRSACIALSCRQASRCLALQHAAAPQHGIFLTLLLLALCVCPCVAAGRTRITLRRTGELYSHVPPSAKVHNLVLGKTWIDSFGPFHVRNTNTGARVEMEFKPCGWFGSGQYEFEGLVLDEQVRQGTKRILISGCCCVGTLLSIVAVNYCIWHSSSSSSWCAWLLLL